MKNTKKPEIMSPIRDWTSFEACKDHADAVYFGLSDLTMRANANAFTLKNISKFVKKCHDSNILVYLTLNSVVYNNNIKRLDQIIKKAKQVEVDAVIVWDPATINIAKKYEQKFIISTQANVSNWESAQFYQALGASRVVLAREITLKQIAEVKKALPGLEIETFIHGAVCMSISGRCILSAYMDGKSANCGACSQPCRREWTMIDENGNKLSNRGKYFMSARDLCMIEYIPELVKAGIDSYKIEGRMRDARYIEVTSRCYREAVDSYFDGTYNDEKVEKWKNELSSVYNRGFSTGFYFGTPKAEGINYDNSGSIATTKKTLVGKITNFYSKIGVAELSLDHRGLKLGEKIVIEGNTTYLEQKVDSLEIDRKSFKKVKKSDIVAIKVNKKVRKNDNVFVLTFSKTGL